MKSTFRVLFYVKKDKQKANGNYPVMCRITVDGEASRFNTKVDVKPENWNAKTGKAFGRSPEITRVNKLLDEINASLHRIYHEMQRQEQVTSEKMKNSFLGITEKHDTLLELFQKHNDDVKALVGISKSAATYQKYEVTRRHITDFISSKYHLSDIALKSINNMFITDFEVYLMTVAKCGHNTTAKFMQFFKRIIIIARNNGMIPTDPFANYKIRLKKVDRGYLTEDEISKILKKKFASDRLEQVRDIFIFSCFTGLSYIDLYNLTLDKIKPNLDGGYMIRVKRQKTGVESKIKLMNTPRLILEKYLGRNLDTLQNLKPNQCEIEERLMPVITNQKMNEYLGEIANICGIQKTVTFHVARH